MISKSNALAWSIVMAAMVWSIEIRAENWPGWRGPRGDGRSAELHPPMQWSNQDNVAWRLSLDGEGHASPIVWGERVFVVSCDPGSKERNLICIDRTAGKVLWKKAICVAPLEIKHALNSFASGTPVTDGERIYATAWEPGHEVVLATNVSKPRDASLGKIVVAAFDFDGNVVWTSRPGDFTSVHGYSSCPVLFEDQIIVNGDHDGESYIVSLNKKTGETLWKVPRENQTRSYVTPIIRTFNDRLQMILSGSKMVTSYDPRTGKQLWKLDGPTEQFVASMVDNGKYVFLTAGYPDKHILAIDPTGSGTIDESKIVWRSNRNCSYVPSPIIEGDYFLVTSDDGIASCYNAITGERLWFNRLGPHYSASPIAANGYVYFIDDRGTTKIVRPGKSFQVVAENKIDDDCFASPALSDGQLFIRTKGALYCIGKRTTP